MLPDKPVKAVVAISKDLFAVELLKLLGKVKEGLSPEQKFNYICTLVQLMKIDERMYKEELMYCSAIATKLGYEKQVMFELMLHVTGDTMEESELNSLKELTEKYLVK